MRRYYEYAIARAEALRAVTQEYYWKLVATPLGKWIPAPNVLAGLVAVALIGGARALGLIDVLPVGWSEAVAGAIVTYWVGPPKTLRNTNLTLLGNAKQPSIDWDRGDSELYPFPEDETDDTLPASQDTGLVD